MLSHVTMKRRTLLAGAAALSATVVSGVVVGRRNVQRISLAPTLAKLDELRGRTLKGAGAWTPYQVFSHMAQSIEYSIEGYPQQKSRLFQASAGAAAYLVFAAAGRMSHDLAEAIPGAPAISRDGHAPEAIDRLIAALQRFEAHRGELKPHFAYGALTRAQYAAAHVLHIEDHLAEIRAR